MAVPDLAPFSSQVIADDTGRLNDHTETHELCHAAIDFQQGTDALFTNDFFPGDMIHNSIEESATLNDTFGQHNDNNVDLYIPELGFLVGDNSAPDEGVEEPMESTTQQTQIDESFSTMFNLYEKGCIF